MVVFIRNDAQTLKQALILKNAATEQYMFDVYTIIILMWFSRFTESDYQKSQFRAQVFESHSN